MSFRDILRLSVENLWRRKWRTVLTTLGVSIGTVSVIIMLSLGFGLKDALDEEMNSYGNINDIRVSYSGDDIDKVLTDSKLEEFSKLDHVESISPVLTLVVSLTEGKWGCTTVIIGLSDDALAEIPVGEGKLPATEGSDIELIVGNLVFTNVYDQNTGEYPYIDYNEIPDIDFMGGNVKTQLFEIDNSKKFDRVSVSSNKHFSIVGMVEGDENTYTRYSYELYTSIDVLKKYLEKNYRGRVIPGQPVDKNGAPLKEWAYEEAVIRVDDSKNVEALVTTLRDMGYSVESNAEWIKENEGIFNIAQMVLGGIGAVALLVSAIGITNTITMSIYERRKEIGIMKVLGCEISDIGAMFVTEAGFIGFLGGASGILLSYIISAIVNLVTGDLMSTAMMVSGNISISVIPLWLPLLGIGFAILIGILAGYFPSRNATKISALEAIRNN